MTDNNAIEFELGNNWAESIWQSLHYTLQTGKKLGIALILETIKDRTYWVKLNTTIKYFNLPIYAWNVGGAMY